MVHGWVIVACAWLVNTPELIAAIGLIAESAGWPASATALGLSSMALSAFAFVGPGWALLVWVYAVLWGIGLPLQAAWVADTFGRANYGAINAMSNSLALSGRIVGALGAALAFDRLGSYTAIMLIGAAGFAVGAVLLMSLRSRVGRPEG